MNEDELDAEFDSINTAIYNIEEQIDSIKEDIKNLIDILNKMDLGHPYVPMHVLSELKKKHGL